MKVTHSLASTEFDRLRVFWRQIALSTVIDSAKFVGSVRKNRAGAIEAEARYYASRHWRLICDCAGISCKPKTLVEFLNDYTGDPTQMAMARMLGVVDEPTFDQSKGQAA